MSIAYYNGNFCDFKDIGIPLTDRSVFFGDGIYDAAIGRCGGIYLEREHIRRFAGNAEKLDIPMPFDESSLSSLLHELIERNDIREYFIYFQLSRYSKDRTHHYEKTSRSNLLITLTEAPISRRDRTLKLITASDIRYDLCNIKTINLLPAVMASERAKEAGCDEAVFCRGATVTECAHSNIAILKDGTLYTHPLTERILPGVTRGRMLFMAERLGVNHKEEPFSVADLFYADDVLITSTTKFIKRASEIDGIAVGNKSGSIADALTDALYDDFYIQCPE